MGGSRMFVEAGERVAVADLIRGIIVQSGNDACVVVAEGLYGTEEGFAAAMTKRARELGLTKSTFGNSNGLPDPANKMTVRELARLARHIVATYPDFYKLFGEREYTWNKIRQQNRNPLLTSLEGADGLKTGFTKEGGYGMVGSAVQNGMRLIVVVNGLEDPDEQQAGDERRAEHRVGDASDESDRGLREGLGHVRDVVREVPAHEQRSRHDRGRAAAEHGPDPRKHGPGREVGERKEGEDRDDHQRLDVEDQTQRDGE